MSSVTIDNGIVKNSVYTCKGKGGEYALVGPARGAGDLHGCDLMIYRELATGVLFFRTPLDFAHRMQLLGDERPDLIPEMQELVEGGELGLQSNADVYAAAMRVIDRGCVHRSDRRKKIIPISHEERRCGFDRRQAVAGRKP